MAKNKATAPESSSKPSTAPTSPETPTGAPTPAAEGASPMSAAGAPPADDAFVAVGATRFDGTVQTQESLDASLAAWTAKMTGAAVDLNAPIADRPSEAANPLPGVDPAPPVVDDMLVPMGGKLADGRTQTSQTIIELANAREATRVAETLTLHPAPFVVPEPEPLPVGALATYDGRGNPTRRSADDFDDEIAVYTPRGFTLHLDDGSPVPYAAGTPRMLRSHAEHWYAIANGVRPA